MMSEEKYSHHLIANPTEQQNRRQSRPSNKSLSIEQIFKEDNVSHLNLFPNPAENTLYLTGNNIIGKKYSIENIQGKVIKNGIISSQIDISTLQSGVYLLNLIDNSKTIKFTKN